jgi:hypothetical protein
MVLLHVMASSISSTISRKDLQTLSIPSHATLSDRQSLSSYNWIEAPKATPTISVPGSPALWSPPAYPRKLDKDTGWFYVAQNAARHPDYPLEPLFRALYISDPGFDIRGVDVVTDRNNLRKLLAFINPATAKNSREAFTIKMEVVHNTVIFCRDETKTMEYVGPQKFIGYGHEFEKVYTRERVSGSTGHHRIIGYQLGGLKFVVRHETDGYVASAVTPATDGDATDLSDALNAMSLNSPTTTTNQSTTTVLDSKLKIQHSGHSIPTSSTLEIKTRVGHRPLSVAEVASQLFFSQTPRLVRAYHQGGIFQTPAVEDVTSEVGQWAQQHEEDLKRLGGLVRKIVETVKGYGGKATLKYDVNTDALMITGVSRDETWKKMLPEDLYAKWDEPEDEATRMKNRHDGSEARVEVYGLEEEGQDEAESDSSDDGDVVGTSHADG